MGFRPCSKRNILVFASLALLASLLFVSSAWAIETRGGQNVTIGADEVIEDDLYVGAETVTVEGTVRGDLVAAGGTVRMNGTVEGDIISAGQTVSSSMSFSSGSKMSRWADSSMMIHSSSSEWVSSVSEAAILA